PPTRMGRYRTVPSVTDSPISGMVIWTVVPADISGVNCSRAGRPCEAAVMAQTTAARRLKHWGWGYEDQQPSEHELSEAAAGIRAHLGFDPEDVETPVPLDEVELPAPRLEPPPSLGEICSSSAHERAAHAYGKAYRDIVRA